MPLRRALVVDDSRLARVALKKQLESYDLSVDLADSGEEALDFLEHQSVDVIFMDHVMPGMSGLDAVRALKRNPKTATVPVMMYTSKEGELYISQARALGAVDVLPKDVQPGLLFDMLLKLGLVRDRRQGEGDGESAERRRSDDEGADARPRPSGIPMHAVLSRIIEDQHTALRSEILGNQLAFAKHVAHEVHEMLKEDEESGEPEAELPVQEQRSGPGMGVLTGILGTALLFLLFAFMNVRSERDALRQDASAMAEATDEARRASAASSETLAGDFAAERLQLQTERAELYATLTWAINEAGSVEFGQVPFNALRVEQLEGFLSRLVNAGFRGTVMIESHLGEFCLVTDQNGAYRLADPGIPVSACLVIGHPLDDSSLMSERETPTFAQFMAESPLVNGSGIEVEVLAYDRIGSIPRVPYPAEPLSAGHWNQVAERNNRVQYTLFPVENTTAGAGITPTGEAP